MRRERGLHARRTKALPRRRRNQPTSAVCGNHGRPSEHERRRWNEKTRFQAREVRKTGRAEELMADHREGRDEMSGRDIRSSENPKGECRMRMKKKGLKSEFQPPLKQNLVVVFVLKSSNETVFLCFQERDCEIEIEMCFEERSYY